MSNSNSILPPIPPDIASTTGPQLIGILFNWALFGVLSVQTYVYYLNFPDDYTWNKILVYGVYILEVVQTAMTAADLYFWFASGFGNLLHLGNVNLSPADTPILCGIIAAVVQCFFVYRIFTLRRSYLWICIFIGLTALTQTVGALSAGIRSSVLQEFSRFHERQLFTELALWLIGDTVCDILIAGTMLWLHYQTRKEGKVQHMNRILGRLVRLIVETNTLTASMALITFISYIALPKGDIFFCTSLIMGKMYSNTLLVTFNNRITLRKIVTNENNSYGSGGSSRTPIRKPYEFGSKASTFRVTTDTFGGKTVDLESYEFEMM